MMKNVYLWLLTSLLFAATATAQYCTNTARYTEVQYFDSSEITIGTNIRYGVALNHLGNPDTLLMDLYYPNVNIDTSPKRPFVMLFHGGGFSSGNKQAGDIRDLCIHLALRGFVCASVGYRLGYDFSEYGQYKARYRAIQDGHAAMRYIVNNANAVRIDTSWLFVGGQSAGSLLALGMVYADQSELDSVALRYNATSTSAELGNLFTSGNTLTNSYTFKGIFNNWGGAVTSEMDDDELLPTIAFHGAKDSVVQIDADDSFLHYTLNGSRAIHNELTAKNICSELTVDTTGGHGIFRNASSVFRVQRASCFFKRIFCKQCTNFYSTDSVPSYCSTLLSVKKENPLGKVQVYPNPFTQSFTIEGLDGDVNIKLYNSMGQLVYEQNQLNGKTDVDVKPGVYMLHITQNETQLLFTKKLVRE